jgi:hypothetical protein
MLRCTIFDPRLLDFPAQNKKVNFELKQPIELTD